MPDEPTVHFVVPGIPQPQGSARAYTYRRKAEKGGGIGARVDSDNPKLKSWRRDVGNIARQAHRGPALKGPIRVVAVFYLHRPKSLRGPKAHTTRPDVDKIARGLADSLTGIVYEDDGQIVQFKVSKCYAGLGESPRADIAITALPEEGRLL